MKVRHSTNIMCFDWCGVRLWAVLQNSWRVLSVFKYCKNKISYITVIKQNFLLLFFFFNVEVTLYVCLVSVSTVFIKMYVFLFLFCFFLQIKK